MKDNGREKKKGLWVEFALLCAVVSAVFFVLRQVFGYVVFSFLLTSGTLNVFALTCFVPMHFAKPFLTGLTLPQSLF